MITPEIESALQHAASVYQLPVGVLRAMAWVETGGSFRTDLVSPAGAQGLMQLMPDTAHGLGVSDPFDVHEATLGAAKYLRQLLNKFGDWERAIAAYNGGQGYIARTPDPSTWYAETKGYVRKVFAHWIDGAVPSFDTGNENTLEAHVVDYPLEPQNTSSHWGVGLAVLAAGALAVVFANKR